MNFDLLRTFVVAAEALNFTKAAETLHLTQPAVSQHVKELEGHFKQPLFERRGRQVALSPAGLALLPFAHDLLGRWQDARESLGQLQGQIGGELALGAGNTAGVYLLPRVLGRFRTAHPHVRVALKVGPTRDLLDMLGHGALDLALMEDATADEARRPLERTPFLTDELVLIAPPNGPTGPLTPSDLAALPLLVRSATSATERAIRASLAAAGLPSDRPHIALELGSTEAIKQGVMAGLGVGFVSRFAIREEVAALRLRIVPIDGVHVERQLWLVAPVRHTQPAAVRLFQAFLLADEGYAG